MKCYHSNRVPGSWGEPEFVLYAESRLEVADELSPSLNAFFFQVQFWPSLFDIILEYNLQFSVKQ